MIQYIDISHFLFVIGTCIHTYIYRYIYIYKHTCIYTHICIHMYTYVYVYIYVYTYMYIYKAHMFVHESYGGAIVKSRSPLPKASREALPSNVARGEGASWGLRNG